MHKWNSARLKPTELLTLILIGGFVGAMLIFIIQNAIMESWRLITDNDTLNLILYGLMGLFLSSLYYGIDYYRYHNLMLEMDEHSLKFYKDRKLDQDFSFYEMRGFTVGRLAYTFQGYYRVTISFKSKKNHRRYNKIILIPKEQETTFIKHLDAGARKVFETHKQQKQNKK